MKNGLSISACLPLLVLTLVGSTALAATPTATEFLQLAGLNDGDTRENALFGSIVAIDGDTALVSAVDEPASDVGYPSFYGAVYVYTRTGGVWSLQQRIVPDPSIRNGNSFGRALALDGDTAVISAPMCPSDNNGWAIAYIYVRSEGAWSLRERLGGPCSRGFGAAVALSGNTLLIGSPGEYYGNGLVYELTRVDGTWTGYRVLEPSALTPTRGFGNTLALDGDTALIGAPTDSDGGAEAGAVYVFRSLDGVWQQQQKLRPNDGTAGGYFGSSVAIQGGTALIGTYGTDATGLILGSAYVFTENAGIWGQQQKLTASDGALGDYFGLGVALDGDTAVIAANADDDTGLNAGSAYVFRRTGSTWSESAKLLASDGAAYDQLGGARQGVAISGGTVLVGASRHDSIRNDDGAAYLYDISPPIIRSVANGLQGNNGWYVSNVDVSWVVTDLDTAVSTSVGCDPTSVSTDTVEVTFSCSATSSGGASTASVTVKRDATAPVSLANAAPAANQYGWRNQAVTVTFSGSDALSGGVTCDPGLLLANEGAGQTATGRCYDAAGNQSALASVSGVNIDMTPPIIIRQKGSKFTCSDALSGILSCTGTTKKGKLTVVAVDRAGNRTVQ